MPARWIGLLLAVAICVCMNTPSWADEDQPAAEFAPTFSVDVSESPEVAEWAAKAKLLCEKWYPKFVKEYATEGHKPAQTVMLHFKKDYDGIAATTGTKITIASEWITKHPDDFGMVIHEVMHVIQSYPPSRNAGWLVEGIADYVRYWQFEPEKNRPLQLNEKSTYKQGYGVAATFLAWLERVKSPGIVMKLHTALRTRTYKDALFQEITGRSLDDLWTEFVTAGGKVPDLPTTTPAAGT